MGGSYVTLSDFWSSLNNPANLSYQPTSYQAGAYYENSYLIKELNLTSIAATYSSKSLNIGFYLSRFGTASYNQGDASLAWSKKAWKGISVGGKLVYHYIQTTEAYGSVAALTGEVGISAQVGERLSLAIHVVNPTNEFIGNEVKEPLPSSLVIGATFATPWGISLFTDVRKPTLSNLSIHTGVEWSILKSVHARIGYQSMPNLLSLGIGYSAKLISFDFAISKHYVLGYSPNIAVVFHFNRLRRQP